MGEKSTGIHMGSIDPKVSHLLARIAMSIADEGNDS